jgi:glucose/arabinose dehydrogenase
MKRLLRGSRYAQRAVFSACGLGAAALILQLTGGGVAGSAPSSAQGGFSSVTVRVPAANKAAPFNQKRTLRVPTGWSVEVWARVAGARFAVWTPQHTLLVSVPGSGDIVELDPGAKASAVPTETTLVDGLTEPQGMAFDTLNGQTVLYVAESDQIDRYVWNSNGTVGAQTVLVSGLPDLEPTGDDVHRVKEVAVGSDHTVYVDVGSSSNASPPDGNSVAPRASIMAYQPNGTGQIFATGIRNGDGLAFDPDGELWTAVNERDDISYPFHQSYGGFSDAYGQQIQKYVNNHPTDELAKVTSGRNLGWPYCDPDPDVSPGAAKTKFNYANVPFDADAQTNSGGTTLNCNTLAPIERGIPAHSAPLGLTFLEGSALPAKWANGAVVGVHGSWDKTPTPRAPAVLWFPWEADQKTLGSQVTLVSGFQGSNGSRWGRVVDAVPGPDGSLYVTDDSAGAVYRVTPGG